MCAGGFTTDRVRACAPVMRPRTRRAAALRGSFCSACMDLKRATPPQTAPRPGCVREQHVGKPAEAPPPPRRAARRATRRRPRRRRARDEQQPAAGEPVGGRLEALGERAKRPPTQRAAGCRAEARARRRALLQLRLQQVEERRRHALLGECTRPPRRGSARAPPNRAAPAGDDGVRRRRVASRASVLGRGVRRKENMSDGGKRHRRHRARRAHAAEAALGAACSF